MTIYLEHGGEFRIGPSDKSSLLIFSKRTPSCLLFQQPSRCCEVADEGGVFALFGGFVGEAEEVGRVDGDEDGGVFVLDRGAAGSADGDGAAEDGAGGADAHEDGQDGADLLTFLV